jgi:hypothetical protein
VAVESTDLPDMRNAIEGAVLDRDVAVQLERALDSFLEAHGTSSFADKHAELILALQSVCGRAIR